MSDPRSILQTKFAIDHRFANFGPVLMQMHVKGFRCHSNTLIEITSPITAFCGLNGTGKSTLLQLAAASYVAPVSDWPRYYIRTFLDAGTLDPNPFTEDARVEYKFWQEDRSLKSLTISRGASKWSGYTRRLQRFVQFAWVGCYLPWIEQRDAVVRHANNLTVEDSEDVAAHVKTWSCRVLGRQYDSIRRNTVSYATQKRSVVRVQRGPNQYSEAHMGYGEARSQYLIQTIESLPPQSLVLIEEPEISLHSHAQHEFGCYLVDVSSRNGHQVLLTTHSEPLLAALPSESRVYLHAGPQGTEVIRGLTATEANSLMTKGHEKALHVLVEDSAALAILTELIRRVDGTLLSTIGIYVAGGASEISAAVKTVGTAGLPVAGVLDGDKAANPRGNMFKLPGTRAPERELFASLAVQELVRTSYNLELHDFEAGLAGVDHHQWCERLAAQVQQTEPALVSEMARAYAKSLPEIDASSLRDLLREASRQ
jgi:predicted ATP-dependent endonuclease of OLD family